MKLIGYILMIIANVVLADCGIKVSMWQWWAINLCFIVGECMIYGGE